MRLTVCDHIPGDECRLYGISDVHLGSPDCDERLFEADLARIRDDPQARLVVNGDLLNYVTRHSKGDVYHEAYPPSQQKKRARELLGAVRDKILAIVGGNHDELRSQEDAQPIEDLADYLGVAYCRGEALLKIPVGSKKNQKPAVYVVYALHGWTSARLIGAKALNLHRLREVVLADVYVISHTHQQMVFPDLYMVPDLRNNNVMEIVQHFVNTGSYQRRGQYPIRKGLGPKVLGTPLIRLSGTEKRVTVEI